jgi:hypothetical protein
MKRLATKEASKVLELQRRINSFEDMLEKQSRDLITAVNRAAQFEFAYEVCLLHPYLYIV